MELFFLNSKEELSDIEKKNSLKEKHHTEVNSIYSSMEYHEKIVSAIHFHAAAYDH